MGKGELLDWRKMIVDDTFSFMECAFIRGVSLSMLKPRGRSLISYFDGVSFNSQYIKEVRDKLSDAEFGWLCLLALTVRPPLNALYDGDVHYNEKGLQSYLGFKNRKQSVDFLKKLVEIGVLLRIKAKVNGRISRAFVMNPYIAFRGTVVDNQSLDLFGEAEAV